MNSHEHRLIEWMLGLGEYPQGELTWQADHRVSRTYSGKTETNTTLHAPKCEEILVAGAQEMQMAASGFAGVHLCRTCALRPLAPGASSAEIKELLHAAHGLHRVWTWTETAASTDHVLVGRWNSALHAGVFSDVAVELHRELDRINIPALASLKQKTEEHLRTTAECFPSSRKATLEAAIREAAASVLFFSDAVGDKTVLGAKYNDVQELFYHWLSRTRLLGSPDRAAEETVTDPRFTALAEAGVGIEELLENWREKHHEASANREPAYFFASGLPSGLHGIPRSARDHLVATGLRHRDQVWGYGELPRVVVEWLTRPAGEKDTKVRMLDVEHSENLETDVFVMALQLMRENQSHRADEQSDLRTPEGALTAAILL